MTSLLSPSPSHYHQWIEYWDSSGQHWCEPEFFAILPTEVLLVECKRTGCNYGVQQMEGLYAPLLAHLFLRPVRCLQVCKIVTRDTPGPYVDDLAAFINSSLPRATWHWPH